MDLRERVIAACDRNEPTKSVARHSTSAQRGCGDLSSIGVNAGTLSPARVAAHAAVRSTGIDLANWCINNPMPRWRS